MKVTFERRKKRRWNTRTKNRTTNEKSDDDENDDEDDEKKEKERVDRRSERSGGTRERSKRKRTIRSFGRCQNVDCGHTDRCLFDRARENRVNGA